MSAVTFASRSPEHRLVMEPTDYEWKGNRISGETKGHAIQFEAGIFRTEDPDEIAFLRSKADEGWVHELAVQSPDPSETLVELVDCDVERVAEILQAEQESWERPTILAACEKRLTAHNASLED